MCGPTIYYIKNVRELKCSSFIPDPSRMLNESASAIVRSPCAPLVTSCSPNKAIRACDATIHTHCSKGLKHTSASRAETHRGIYSKYLFTGCLSPPRAPQLVFKVPMRARCITASDNPRFKYKPFVVFRMTNRHHIHKFNSFRKNKMGVNEARATASNRTSGKPETETHIAEF